jgi:HSP20 family protein
MVSTMPLANILREQDGYTIELAVPGLSRDQIKIEHLDHQLVISAVPKEEATAIKNIRREYDFAGFKRIFRLQKNANVAAISALYHQGTLVIHIPDLVPETKNISIQ